MFSIADPVFREVMLHKPIWAIFTERNTKGERKQQVAKSPTGFNLSKGKKLLFGFVKNLIITNRLIILLFCTMPHIQVNKSNCSSETFLKSLLSQTAIESRTVLQQ